MTAKLSLPHFKIDQNGRFRYRRRVPENLHESLGKTEFIKVLGRTEREAVLAYGPYHREVEDVIAFGKITGGEITPMVLQERVTGFLKHHQADPHSSGRTADERHARQELVDDILGNYQRSDETGEYEALSPSDEARVRGLLGGINAISAEPTVIDAFDLYLKEKALSDPFKLKKQKARFGRIKEDALIAFRHNLTLSKIRKSHAKALRDRLLQRMKVTSVQREIANLKAVLNFAAGEYEVPECTAFKGLTYPHIEEAAVERRNPLPPHVIDQMYADLQDSRTLLEVWTLVHHTGAQNAEILGLLIGEFQLSGPVPHIVIKPRELRSLKDPSRIRKVPLVGRALAVAQEIVKRGRPDQPAFPEYCETAKHENFSTTINTRLRKHTKNPKHVFYSLRHNIKDSMIEADVPDDLRKAIMGHSLGSGSHVNYGSGYSLQKMADALNKSLLPMGLHQRAHFAEFGQ